MTVRTGLAAGRSFSQVLKAAAALILVALTAAALPAVADAQRNQQPPNINVLSRNLYLGSDLTQALTAPDAQTLFLEAGEVWRNVHRTNFNARAKLLADEIQRHGIEVVGLQEVALWRRGPLGVVDGPATPAEEVVHNFLFQLRSELRNRGIPFRVASRQQQADFEIPLDFGDGPVRDGRLTMHDVIIVKRTPRLRVQRSQSAQFGPALPIDLPAPIPDIQVFRGWNSVDLVKIGAGPLRTAVRSRFRVVNTHLEAFSAFFRFAQANSLVATGILDAARPVILLGDLNSDPDDPSVSPSPPEPVPTPNAAAYQAFANEGFVDRGVPVNTCCHDDDLLNPTASFTSRIDHVLTKPGLRRMAGRLLGAQEHLRTPAGLWPSDHGGVWSRLRLRR